MCARCEVQLAGQKFAAREDAPYCAHCFGELFAKRCAACSRPITGQGGTRYRDSEKDVWSIHVTLFVRRFISFEGRHWHSDCFVCALCKQSMAGKVGTSYICIYMVGREGINASIDI